MDFFSSLKCRPLSKTDHRDGVRVGGHTSAGLLLDEGTVPAGRPRIQRSITAMRTFLPLKTFRRLTILPLAILALLCLVLSYGLHSVERRSLAVDDADLVIAHSNNLIKLMVDEETGLRGYLLTKNHVFLEPFQVADKQMDSEFSALFGLLSNYPAQTRQLVELQRAHQEWKLDAEREVSDPSAEVTGNAFLLKRKQTMDGMRGEMDSFASWAETQRTQTLAHTLRSNRMILFGTVDFAILLAAFLLWQTQRGIRDIIRTHLELQGQLDKG
jgi:CHASE3 domain sensor protein